MPMPYPQGDVLTALRAPSRTWDFRYERLDRFGSYVGPLTMRDVKIRHDALAENIKRSLTGSLAPDSLFDYLADRARVYARLLMPDGGWQEWAVGTFLLSTSTTRRRSTVPRDVVPVVGYDLLQVLLEAKTRDRVVFLAGVGYASAIGTMLGAAGFPTHTVAPTTKTLPAAMEWEPGVTILKVVNDLLAAINYQTLSMDPFGQPTSMPYRSPADAAVLWPYALDSASMVRPGTTADLDLFDVPNVIIGYVSSPERTLRSVAVNADPLSPTSTVRRGREIVRTLDSTEIGDAADQATLDALVARKLEETYQQYETITFETGVMPFHGDGDVVTFDYGFGGPLRFRETSWEIELRAGGAMQHTARRVVAVG